MDGQKGKAKPAPDGSDDEIEIKNNSKVTMKLEYSGRDNIKKTIELRSGGSQKIKCRELDHDVGIQVKPSEGAANWKEATVAGRELRNTARIEITDPETPVPAPELITIPRGSVPSKDEIVFLNKSKVTMELKYPGLTPPGTKTEKISSEKWKKIKCCEFDPKGEMCFKPLAGGSAKEANFIYSKSKETAIIVITYAETTAPARAVEWNTIPRGSIPSDDDIVIENISHLAMKLDIWWHLDTTRAPIAKKETIELQCSCSKKMPWRELDNPYQMVEKFLAIHVKPLEGPRNVEGASFNCGKAKETAIIKIAYMPAPAVKLIPTPRG